MDHTLQTISYIADIGSVLVIMARRRLPRRPAPQAHGHQLYKMVCHVFHSEDVSSRALGILGDRKIKAALVLLQSSPGDTLSPASFRWSSALPAVFHPP